MHYIHFSVVWYNSLKLVSILSISCFKGTGWRQIVYLFVEILEVLIVLSNILAENVGKDFHLVLNNIE